VLVTQRDDLTADLVVLELQERHAEFMRFNTEDFATRATLNWTPHESRLAVRDRVLEPAEVGAVWWRRPAYPSVTTDRPHAQAVWAGGEAQTALEGFWRMTNAHWVNRPEANDAADCKPEQLMRAIRCGFDVPATLVTNDADSVRMFAGDVGPIVCKALRDGVVPTEDGDKLFFTTVVDVDGPAALDELGPEPYLFQALVAKRYDVRVTVIGDDAWACRIDSRADPSAAIDWRRVDPEGLTHEIEKLPKGLTQRCIELVHSYGLRFAAIDLARRPDGGYSFFELNANGEWGWIERLIGLPICSALVDELLGGAK
jgi:hypothetical protein